MKRWKLAYMRKTLHTNRSVLSADKTQHTNKEEVYRYKVTARGVLSTIFS